MAVNVNISAYPWLCSTMPKRNQYCSSVNGNIVSDSEGHNAEAFTTEAYGKYGLQSVYYKISENLKRDRIFGEDQLQVIERAFNFMLYTESLPPNVRTYQIQGIWGEDVVTCYVGVTAFKYWSTYGGKDRNTPKVYDDFQPRIGDVVYLPQNNTFYEIRDVKYYQEAFGLQSHTYTLTLRVYKDTKLTIKNDSPTIPLSDPIWYVATKDFPEQYNINDPLKTNDYLKYEALKKSKNVNHMDVLYNPNKDYEILESYADTIAGRFGDYSDQLREIGEKTYQIMQDADGMDEEFDKFKEKVTEDTTKFNKELDDMNMEVDEFELEKVTYTSGDNGLPKPNP